MDKQDIAKIITKYHKIVQLHGDKQLNFTTQTLAKNAQKNFDEATLDITGTPEELDVFVMYRLSKNKSKVIAHGPKVAFIEFGTGTSNPDYPIDSKLIAHGTYGKLKGKQRAWGFYASGKEQLNNRDFRHINRKKDGSEKEVIITYGIVPSRAFYNAIKDTKEEVKKSK